MPKHKINPKKHDSQIQLAGSQSLVTSAWMPMGALLNVFVAFIVYFPSINGKFIWDDLYLITENTITKASDGLFRFWCTTEPYDYWPVTNTTFWIEWRLWGMNSTGYHVTNLILHIIESLLIWLILRKLSIPGDFLAAMLFAVHPVNVKSVAWIAQRKNMVAMLFFLLSILWYLRLVKSAPLWVAAKPIPNPQSLIPILWYWLSLTAFVFAMLSKGSVAVLPVMLLWIVWLLRPLTRWDLVRTSPFFLVAVMLTGVNMWFQTHGTGEVIRTASIAQRLQGAGGVVWFYLYKSLLPIDLAFIYPQWQIKADNLLWCMPMLAALAVTAVLWLYKNSWGRPLLFAWGFFCVAIVPVMGLTDVYFMKFSLVADHYQHIAIVGVVALASAGWSVWHQRTQGKAHWTPVILAVTAVGALAFLTWRQSGLYREEITLYRDTLKKNPECWLAYNNMGFIYQKTGRPKEAIEYFQQALRLKPDFAEAHNNFGGLLIQLGRTEEAIKHLQQTLQVWPNSAEAHNNLGIALFHEGRLPEAMEHYRQALQIKPNFSDAYSNMGNVLFQTGRLQEAIEHYEQALRLNPDCFEAHNRLGIALIQTDRLQEAIGHFQQAMRLKHGDPEVHYNLGNALNKAGEVQEAIPRYLEAIRLNPDYVEAFANLASTYGDAGRSSEATAAAQKALELARSKGQTALAKQIENWLKSYLASLSDLPNASPPSKSVPLPPQE